VIFAPHAPEPDPAEMAEEKRQEARALRTAANVLRHGSANMDVLVAMVTLAAYGFSV
jgi:hypothetical protein